jgi:hypothetical protein
METLEQLLLDALREGMNYYGDPEQAVMVQALRLREKYFMTEKERYNFLRER